MSKIFVDTNILLYGADHGNPTRQKKCQDALRSLSDENEGVISTQVMQEFYVGATRKLGIEPLQAKQILHSFENFEVIMVDIPIIKDAIDCSILNQISFWDALIIVTAESAKCDQVWTEDLSHGQVIHGVRIENILRHINKDDS